MSNLVTDAPEAMKKLRRHTGGFGTYLSPAEEAFIDAAIAPITIAEVVTTAGPATLVQVDLATPYAMASPFIIQVDMEVDGVAEFFAASGVTGDLCADLVSRLCQEGRRILNKLDKTVRVEPSNLANIKDTAVVMTAAVDDLEVIAAVVVAVTAADVVITTAPATTGVPGVLTPAGVYLKGQKVFLRFTSDEFAGFDVNWLVPRDMLVGDANKLLAQAINNANTGQATAVVDLATVEFSVVSATDTITCTVATVDGV